MPHADADAPLILDDSPARQDSVWSLAAFWIVAFIGASLFAAVLIAPKWEQRQLLRERVRHQLALCAYLNDVNNHFQRVIDAFKHDPEFNAQVARFALGYAATNEQRVPAPIHRWDRPKPPEMKPAEPDALDPFIRLFARDRVARHTALLASAAFVIVSVAFFNSKSAGDE